MKKSKKNSVILCNICHKKPAIYYLRKEWVKYKIDPKKYKILNPYTGQRAFKGGLRVNLYDPKYPYMEMYGHIEICKNCYKMFEKYAKIQMNIKPVKIGEKK